MKNSTLALGAFLIGVTLKAAGPVAEPFSLADVKLLAGPFRDAMERDHAYLLRLDPDRAMAPMRREAGLPHKADPYGGWESMDIAGEFAGHYLSALAMMWQSTGDAELLRRVNYLVAEMAECQAMGGDGYFAGIPRGRAMFADVAAGKITVPTPHRLNGVWAPWYNLHKTFAGLRDAHLLCGNAQARAVLVRFADWADAEVSHLTDAQMQRMLDAEFGGMGEVLADVFALTGDAKYLRLARRFTHDKFFAAAAAGRDELGESHANTQIPKFIGFARIAELDGDAAYAAAARNFWRFVAEDRSWSFGGNSSDEHFLPPARYAAEVRSMGSAETCNTYNMLKLTEQLFWQAPTEPLMAFYERGLYNHILSSQEPLHGGMAYFTPLRPGHFKLYSTEDDSMWCCVGTGIENHAKYAEAIYAHDATQLWINLFIPSELTWAARGVTLWQETRLPEEDATRLQFTCREPVKLTLKIRHPQWVDHGALLIEVNGAPVAAEPGADGYVDVRRQWRSGDTVTVHLPMRVRVETLPGNAEFVSLLYGPVLLAAELGTAGLEQIKFNSTNTLDDGPIMSPVETPEIVRPLAEIAVHVAPVAGRSLAFRTHGLMQPQDVTLVPFHQVHFQRYAIYWRATTEAGRRVELARYAWVGEHARELDARTFDRVQIGDEMSERAHQWKDYRSWGGLWELDRRWRDARADGWFSCELKVSPEQPVGLLCAYWTGDDANRHYDILVDGTVIATPHPEQRAPGGYADVVYPIPLELTRGKNHVTIRWQAHPAKDAARVFDLRIVRR